MTRRENIDLRKKNTALEALVDCLQFMPEDVAQCALQRLRATSDPFSTLQTVMGETLSNPPSETHSARGLLPQVTSKLELELIIRHPVVYSYPRLQAGNDLLFSESPLSRLIQLPPAVSPQYAGTTFQEDSAWKGVFGASTLLGSEHTDDSDPQMRMGSESTDLSSLSSGPARGLEYTDPRLHSLDIGFWTAVPVSDDYAAGAISLYLETDHPIIGFFDAQLFVGDLVHRRFKFCSPFLVSSLLSFASVWFPQTSRPASVSAS